MQNHSTVGEWLFTIHASTAPPCGGVSVSFCSVAIYPAFSPFNSIQKCTSMCKQCTFIVSKTFTQLYSPNSAITKKLEITACTPMYNMATVNRALVSFKVPRCSV